VIYRLSTNHKVVPYDILYIVSNFQPNRAEEDFLIGLASAMSSERIKKECGPGLDRCGTEPGTIMELKMTVNCEQNY
jgi:hypothetical protein